MNGWVRKKDKAQLVLVVLTFDWWIHFMCDWSLHTCQQKLCTIVGSYCSGIVSDLPQLQLLNVWSVQYTQVIRFTETCIYITSCRYYRRATCSIMLISLRTSGPISLVFNLMQMVHTCGYLWKGKCWILGAIMRACTAWWRHYIYDVKCKCTQRGPR